MRLSLVSIATVHGHASGLLFREAPRRFLADAQGRFLVESIRVGHRSYQTDQNMLTAAFGLTQPRYT